MPDYVRVRDLQTGHEYDTLAPSSDRHEVLTDYPVNTRGIPRPTKFRTDKANRPTSSWSRARIDEFAADRGVDTSEAANKDEALAQIEAGPKPPPTGEDNPTK